MKRNNSSQWYCHFLISSAPLAATATMTETWIIIIWRSQVCLVSVRYVVWIKCDTDSRSRRRAVWIIYSLKYAIYSQIAPNDHFGQNAFANVEPKRENRSVMNEDDERMRTWTLIAMSPTWSNLKRNSAQREREKESGAKKTLCTSAQSTHIHMHEHEPEHECYTIDTIETEMYEKAFLLVCL